MRLFVLLATSTGNEKNTVGAPEFRDRAGAPGSPAHAKLLQMATGIAQALPAEHKPAVSAADLVDYICAVKVRESVCLYDSLAGEQTGGINPLNKLC